VSDQVLAEERLPAAVDDDDDAALAADPAARSGGDGALSIQAANDDDELQQMASVAATTAAGDKGKELDDVDLPPEMLSLQATLVPSRRRRKRRGHKKTSTSSSQREHKKTSTSSSQRRRPAASSPSSSPSSSSSSASAAAQGTEDTKSWSVVWDVFGPKHEKMGTRGRTRGWMMSVYKCLVCEKVHKSTTDVSCSRRSTSNLWTHLKLKHFNFYALLVRYEKQGLTGNAALEYHLKHLDEARKQAREKLMERGGFYRLDNSHYPVDMVSENILKTLKAIKYGLSFSSFGGDIDRKIALCQERNPKTLLTARKITHTYLPALREVAGDIINDMLCGNDDDQQRKRCPPSMRPACALSSDGWSRRTMEGVYATTASFFRPDNGALDDAVVDASALPGSHTGAVIMDYLKSVVSDVEEDGVVVLALTADGGADIKSAASVLFKRRYLHCIAHRLQLVVVHAMEAAGDNLKNAIDSIRTIVKTIRKSRLLSETYRTVCKQTAWMRNLKLVLDQATRWSSLYCMLARFVEQRFAIAHVAREHPEKLREHAPLQPLFAAACTLCLILQPLKVATVRVQSATRSTLPSIAEMLAQIRQMCQRERPWLLDDDEDSASEEEGREDSDLDDSDDDDETGGSYLGGSSSPSNLSSALKALDERRQNAVSMVSGGAADSVEELLDQQHGLVNNLRLGVLDQIEVYFGGELDDPRSLINVASLIHPRHKHGYLSRLSTESKQSQCREHLIELMMLLVVDGSEQQRNKSDCRRSSSSSSSSSLSKARAVREKMKHILKVGLKQWLKEDVDDDDNDIDVVQFWNDKAHEYSSVFLHCMKSVALIPSTSAASERLFSCASFHETPRRSNLNWEQLESLTYIRYNWKLLDINKLVCATHTKLSSREATAQQERRKRSREANDDAKKKMKTKKKKTTKKKKRRRRAITISSSSSSSSSDCESSSDNDNDNNAADFSSPSKRQRRDSLFSNE
jgi:hAT family C-terminal dimerisation region